MSTTEHKAKAPKTQLAEAAAGVLTCNGSYDTEIKTGADYGTLTWAGICAMAEAPATAAKKLAPAIIPSTYHAHDGRAHEAQRQRGQFIMLCVDVDKGNHSKAEVIEAMHRATGSLSIDLVVYSTSSATPENRKWRALVRLAEPIDGADYAEAQHALFDLLEAEGIVCDRKLAATGQLVYLPCVAAERRDANGRPLSYDSEIEVDFIGDGFVLEGSPIAARIEERRIARQAHQQEAAAEAARKRAERAARSAEGGEASIVEQFNQRHRVEDLLADNGFDDNGLGDWHWDQQETGSYATRVYDGDDGQYWVSLSGTVASAGIGHETKSGARTGDAFDLLVHFTHKGDWAAAMGAASIATADDFEDLTNDPELLAAQAEWDAAQAAEAQERQRHLDAFAPIIAASLAGRPVPPRKWHVPMIIPAGTVTGLAGNGGIGKSLLALQLAVATAIGGLWVGLECSKGRALYIGAEDDSDEMHGRLADICSAMSIEMADLTDLEIAPMAGFDTVLAEAKRSGKVEGTKLWQKVRAHVEATRPTLIVFDTLADLFAGDENVRTQAQQFVGLLRGLCVEFGATALLLTHPSLTGLASGTGLSGSTAWNNSVRSRLYLAKPDEAPEDTKLRVLRQVKNNYGTSGNVVATLVWSEGALHALSDDVQAGEDEAHRALARDAFLEAFGVNERAGLTVSPNRSASFAPTVFWKTAGGKKSVFSKEDFTTAMRELLEAGALAIATKGSASRETKILIRGKGKPPEEKMDLSTTTSKAAPNG
jgi:hypothetical protein